MKYIVNTQNLFEAENVRDNLAKSRRNKKFKDSYSTMFVAEKDLNTPKFWNRINSIGHKDLVSSSIYKDKVKQILKMLKAGYGNLLDVGVGTGEVEKSLQNSKYNLFGIDIASSTIKIISRKLIGTYKIGNILKIPFNRESMDVILALDVLEHLPTNSTFRAYSEFSRVLKKNGKLIISVPLNEGLELMLEKGTNPNGHLRAYTSEILKYELEMSGYKVLEEHFLYAFRKYYLLKKLILKLLPIQIRKPNLMILVAQKK
ncbi:MAG: Methyltransferase [Microgenomates group bacterium GW2011_GWC1_39_7b]|uniref:Methyltransferase n=3 Tax=Candidatus Woeseibacteriota TaxID=1752722 RepID=A0A0G0LL10_9BACT|nr:MAG: Methyltransferase [Candidatus Woesebacteria bacterium GW2011_GWB1_39_10]KKR26893.1 MAG: Methyltransferase [Microgenomates group bacterium GW2011_GWC1_39_7b]KKR73744.1 MAG: Methyltransferase [Candidatus Woesebacteria bacterium GW2011_GWA2_40_7]KKS90714.1 MAG: Methyltransferase [Candidatus Woesebacteria bacterium GW2011_GWA1_43_12]